MKFNLQLKEKTTDLVNKINDGEFTGREIFMAGITLFVTGILLGFIFSPKKSNVFGSNNGNNNSGSFTPSDEKKDEE